MKIMHECLPILNSVEVYHRTKKKKSRVYVALGQSFGGRCLKIRDVRIDFEQEVETT